MSLNKNFTKEDISIEKEEIVFDGVFKIKKFQLKHSLFDGGESQSFTRELFCRGESIGVLLYDPELDRVGLVKQFRIGCLENKNGPWVWEVIAGVNDKKENFIQVALRETEEESGLRLTPENLIPICEYYNSPGGSDEYLSLFCGITSLDEEESIHGLQIESEDILFKTLAYDEASAMLGVTADGREKINNAATIISLQWLQLNRKKLRERFC